MVPAEIIFMALHIIINSLSQMKHHIHEVIFKVVKEFVFEA